MSKTNPKQEGGPPNPLNPCSIGAIDCSLFKLPEGGLTEEQRIIAINALNSYMATQLPNFIGYQVNQKFSFSQDYANFLDFSTNNVGDPFSPGYLTLNTKFVEIAVLDWFARLWGAVTPHDPSNLESYWGYALTMGSSEGNLYALWSARDYLQGKTLLEEPESPPGVNKAAGRRSALGRPLHYAQAKAPNDNPNAYRPIAFYSEDTHYSIIKAMAALCIDTFYEVGTNEFPGQCPITADGTWPQEAPSKEGALGPGSIDIDHLAALVEFFAARGFPIMVSLNFGSTFKGAYDDVEEVCARLEPIFKKYGLMERTVEYAPGKSDVRTGYWLHVDAALGGSYMPFVKMAAERGQGPLAGRPVPKFDFSLPMLHSLVTSGHKWIGAPWPCGVIMSKVKYQISPPDDPAYIGSPDTTFAGSRNAFSPLILWDSIARHSYEAQIQKAVYTEVISAYAYDKLNELSRQLYFDQLWVQRTPLALTVRFRQPNANLVYKYSLSSETLQVGEEIRNYSHVYLMEHVTTALIDQLIADLSQPGAFDVNPGERPSHPIVKSTAEAEPVGLSGSNDYRKMQHVPHFGRGFR